MNDTLPSQTVSVPIAAPPGHVYEFAGNPLNLPAWAPRFALSVRRDADRWLVQTPYGPVEIEFAPDNELGVLDHSLTLPSGVTIFNAMRVIANADGSEVMITTFRLPGMTEEQHRAHIEILRNELWTLKRILEEREQGC